MRAQWHDLLWLLRHTLFLLLPYLTLLLPRSLPQTSRFHPLTSQLDALVHHFNFLRLEREAVSHNPQLRSALVREWERIEREEGGVWADGRFREVAREVGMSLDGNSPFMRDARGVVQRLWAMTGLLPPLGPRAVNGVQVVANGGAKVEEDDDL